MPQPIPKTPERIDQVPECRAWPTAEQLKYCQALFVWKKYSDFVPESEELIKRRGRSITWAEWFKERHAESVDDYRVRIKRRIRAVEIQLGDKAPKPPSWRR